MSNYRFFFLFLIVFSACSTPLAKFQMVQKTEVVPARVNFKNASKNADEYLWDFGDGEKSTSESPEHVYENSGRYLVSLVAKKGEKSNTFQKEIFFNAPNECLIRLVTSEGTLIFQLDDDTPKHRDNFVRLVKNRYYEGLLFHRVIQNFMLQGGDPDSKFAEEGKALGIGGPGYQIPAEFNDHLVHFKGALAAARTGDAINPEKESSGSQFYIVHGNSVSDNTLDKIESTKGFIYPDSIRTKYMNLGGAPFLDREYSVFGMLVDGFDVLDKIAMVSTDKRDRPVEDIKIIKMEVVK